MAPENANARRGFTLIELLVTMGLIVLLLSIALAVTNSAMMDSYKLVGAGDRLSQSLITAKARAARDKAPRGIRLLAGPVEGDGVSYYRELVYIEQPEPWLPDQSFTLSGSTANEPFRSQIALRYKQNPAPATTPPSYPKPLPTDCSVYLMLTANDLLRFQAMFLIGQIHTASSPDMPAAFAFSNYTDVTAIPAETLSFGPAQGLRILKLNVTSIINPDLAAGQSPTPAPGTVYRSSFQTPNFGIYQPAKPLAGEPTVILSKNAAVDPLACLPQITLLPTGAAPNVDILFAPAGHVMYRSEGMIAFLIRDTYKSTPVVTGGANWLTDANGPANFNQAGELLLVAVFPRTGTVATKPVAEPTGLNPDPYKFARDAISTGGL